MTKRPLEQVIDWIYSTCPHDADALVTDAYMFGSCTIKTNADGTTERVDPMDIHSEAPAIRETAA